MELIKINIGMINFFLYSGGMLLGIFLGKIYQGIPIIPTINKSIPSSILVTILYLAFEHFTRLTIDPYGDFFICISLGLFAESIIGKLLEQKVGIANFLIPLLLKKFIDEKTLKKIMEDNEEVNNHEKNISEDSNTDDEKKSANGGEVEK